MNDRPRLAPRVNWPGEPALARDIAYACRILATAGHEDYTLGHVSARSADGTISMKRRDVALSEVTVADILVLDGDGSLLAGNGQIHLEAVLHTEVYRVRPDVGSVIHTHPHYATALGASDAELQYVSHDAVMFCDGLPNYNDTAALVTSADHGHAVARALGSHSALLMRNHGILIASRDVPWAVLTALTLERAARIQYLANIFGKVEPMPAEVARKLFPDKYHDELVYSYWDYLVRRARRQGCDVERPD